MGISTPLVTEKRLKDFSLGLFIAGAMMGGYFLVKGGWYMVIGVPGWTPHAYNFLIWSSFAATVVYKRWGMLTIPAAAMIYGIDEILWTTTFDFTNCNRQFEEFTVSHSIVGSLGYYLMVIVLAVVSFYVVRPHIRLRWFAVIPFVTWFLAYTFYFKMPIIANECLPAQIPSNLPWEIAWQLAWLAFAYFTFFPRGQSLSRIPKSL